MTRAVQEARWAERQQDIRQAAKDALMVQDASNLAGVVNTLAQYMPAVLADARRGTQEANQHPVVVLFVDKMAALCGLVTWKDDENARRFQAAYRACQALAADLKAEEIRRINGRE